MTIDIPKDYVCVGAAEACQTGLAALRLDAVKLDRVARAVAAAILLALGRLRSAPDRPN